MPKTAAGLLMYRTSAGRLEVFLVHPGGPMWARKNKGWWTMPKGEYQPPEEPLEAAQREFKEETSFTPHGPYASLGAAAQASGKLLTAYAFQGDCDPALLQSNTCEIEWPPRSAKRLEIPEIDRGDWFTLDSAREHIRPGQIVFLDALVALLHGPGGGS